MKEDLESYSASVDYTNNYSPTGKTPSKESPVIDQDTLARASIKLINERKRLQKNDSRMLTLPHLCDHPHD